MQTLDAIPGELPLCWVMGQRYVRVLVDSGALPWLIPLFPDNSDLLRDLYSRLDGIFLTGGMDMTPNAYGEARHERCGRTDSARDAVEMELIRWAKADGKPVLGVCRGIQVINVALGGTLYQDLEAQYAGAIKHDYFPPAGGYTRSSLVHDVYVAPNSRLADLLGVLELPVNSMHHQGIKTLAPGLQPTVTAPDGLIEGIESPNGNFLVGVQWHPEELADSQPSMQRLFSEFLEAASAR
jgi:putative glutamine amidotransferase